MGEEVVGKIGHRESAGRDRRFAAPTSNKNGVLGNGKWLLCWASVAHAKALLTRSSVALRNSLGSRHERHLDGVKSRRRVLVVALPEDDPDVLPVGEGVRDCLC